ncbi:uncharacterized protein LOC143282039 [Babylonia areolata]|uniref:uncharacterized protein LOC143282039 n=1 Tax=Babylonia areolata TaxID=304850 RepID=UPI003FD62137
MKCTPLLLPPSSIPTYRPPSPDVSSPSQPPPPPVVPTVDCRRLLVNSARRRETASVRERWNLHQQQQKTDSMTSRIRHPKSAPLPSTSSRSAMSDLRKQIVAYGYGTIDESDVFSVRRLQFPQLEQELTKRNLTQRLPYHVKVEVGREERVNYPTHHPSNPRFFFFSARGARRPSSPTPSVTPRARCLRNEKEERFFIHPEWSSESVGWRRFVHHSNPAHFRYSWM